MIKRLMEKEKQLMENENKLMEEKMFYLKQEAVLKASNKGIIDSAQSDLNPIS